MLKKTRAAFAIALLTLVTFFFIDFAGLLPGYFNWLERIQFFPAVFAHSAVIVSVIVLFTLLFGRIYCSVICPLGIFQDVSAWVSKCFKTKGRKKRYKYAWEHRVLRWIFFGVAAIAAVCGVSIVVSLLDPYAIYGRMASNLFYPLYVLGNNLISAILGSMGNYTFYHMDPTILSASSLMVALLFFLIVGAMSWRRGRLYCNTVCPVGTLLGIFGRFSLFRIRIDSAKCTSCGVCESRCKSSCISAKGKNVDSDRCINCFNCVDSCKFDALRYAPWKKAAQKEEPIKTADHSRRDFIAMSVAAAFAAPKLLANQPIHVLKGGVTYEREHPIAPPGARAISHLNRHCTACHLCISKCPSRVLKPAFTEYGLNGFMQPMMFFKKGFCNFDCTVCGDVCPNGAIQSLSIEEKHITQVGRVVFLKANCVVYTDNTSCGACSEHCPTQAVTMVPYGEGLTIPQTNPNICVGCGGCEFICPVRPFRAIYVNGNPEHRQRDEFHDEVQDIKVDDFGF